MSFEMVGARAANTVTLAMAKAQCRVTHSFEDDLFTNVYIPSALEYCEKYTERILLGTRYRDTLTACDGYVSFSGFGPVTVEEVARVVGVTATVISESDYTIEYFAGAMIVRSDSFTDGDSIRVTIYAGFDPLPATICDAMLLYVHDRYENRGAKILGTFVTVNVSMHAMLDQHRVWSL